MLTCRHPQQWFYLFLPVQLSTVNIPIQHLHSLPSTFTIVSPSPGDRLLLPDFVSFSSTQSVFSCPNCCNNSQYQLDWTYLQSLLQYGPALPVHTYYTQLTVNVGSSQMESCTISQYYNFFLKMFLCVPSPPECPFSTFVAKTLLFFMSFPS